MLNRDPVGMHVSLSGRVLVGENPLLPGDEDLIANHVGAGASVVLAPGVYVFATGWRTELPYELIGAGKDETVLRFANPASPGGAAIEWHGAGTFRLSGLTLEYAGESASGSLVRIESGDAELQDIAVRRAKSNGAAYAPAGGLGVVFTGSSRGRLDGSTLESNEVAGLVVEHDASVVVGSSAIRSNVTGASVRGDASLAVTGSTISDNARYGLEVGGAATAVIIGSTIRGNAAAGVAGNDVSWVTIVNSSLDANGSGFISLGGNAAAQVSILGSTLSGNQHHGVSTGISTTLALVGNTVIGTGSTGLALGASAFGSLVGNRLIANGGSGILCNWTSYGPVIDNVMIANKEYGFIRMEESRCRESGSIHEGNLLGASEMWRPE